MPVKYSDEFKRDSVGLVLEQGMSQRQVCHDMGVSKSALQCGCVMPSCSGAG